MDCQTLQVTFASRKKNTIVHTIPLVANKIQIAETTVAFLCNFYVTCEKGFILRKTNATFKFLLATYIQIFKKDRSALSCGQPLQRLYLQKNDFEEPVISTLKSC